MKVFLSNFQKLIFISLLLVVTSCQKMDKNMPSELNRIELEINVPTDFAYNTTEIQPFHAEVSLPGDIPYEDAKFEIYLDNPHEALKDSTVLKSLRLLSSFKLNKNGEYSSEIRVPSDVDKIYVLGKSIGISKYFEIYKTTAGFQMKYKALSISSTYLINKAQSLNPSDPPQVTSLYKSEADYVYYPAKNTKGTLLFEDCWPRLGDFDMNDMVLNHYYIGELDAFGNVKQINFNFDLAAISADQNNSFAVLIPEISSENVLSVSSLDFNGLNLNSTSGRNYVVEDGHSRDIVIKVFDGASSIMGGKSVNNVGIGSIARANETFSFTIKFINPVPISHFNDISPFIIPRGTRTVETHLANKRPSIKANLRLFGTEDDNSLPEVGRFYLSNTKKGLGNLTWAVDVPMKIPYPKSGKSITKAFKNFTLWATSGGVIKKDWYSAGTDNRNDDYLFYPQ